MSKFHKWDFDARFAKMGDTSERVFEQWATAYKVSYVPFGLSRPPFDYFVQLPAQIRYKPDFLCEAQGGRFGHLRDADGKLTRHFLTEVKAVGHDQVVKIKLDNHDVLQRWQEFTGRPITYFVFDSVKKRVSISLSVNILSDLIDELEVGHFQDRGKPKPYYKVLTTYLEWESVEDLEATA